MKDEELLRSVGAAIRADEATVDATLEALAAGRLSDSQAHAALGHRADAGALIAACRPLASGLRDGLVDRLSAPACGAPVDPGVTVARPRADSTWRRPWRGRRFFVAGAGAALLAAAASVALVVGRTLPPLPPYTASFSGGDVLMRKETAPAEGALRAESRLEWIVRPATAVEGPLATRGFIVRDGRVEPWAPAAHVSSQGAVRIAGRAGELGIPRGRSLLVLIVGRPGALPHTYAQVPGGVRERDFTVHTREVEVVE